MKSKDIAVVGVLLAVGAVIRFISLAIPGPLTSNLVIAFYCLAIILVSPTFKEALGIGIVAGAICALITHSIFPPGNLISEPVGAVVCLAVWKATKNMKGISKVAPGITTLVATFFSGMTFILTVIALIYTAPNILSKAAPPVAGFLTAGFVIVVTCAVVNAIIAQLLYIPSSKVVMRRGG
jgi:hypothetical protein